MKKPLSTILAALLCCTTALAASGCGDSSGSSIPSSASESSGASNLASSGTEPAKGALPITDKEITLSWFVPLYNSNVIQSAGEQYCWQEIQARTGIKLDFIHPPAGSETDTFNVRIASRDFPDVITWPWINFAGGPGKAIDDKVIVKLNDYSDSMQNYNAIIDSIPTSKANSTLDDGSVYGFIHAVPDPIINATGGFQIRKDWLDAVGLEVPKTMEDWYTVLKAFRATDLNGNGQADEIPYIASKGMGEFLNFSVAYSVRNGYYPDPDQGGKIAYGAIQDKFKTFLAEMNKWYTEGLIDPEFPTNARKNLDEKITNSTAGAFYGAIGSQLGSYNLNGAKVTPGFELVGVAHPVNAKGISYTTMDSILQGIGTQSSTVTTSNAHPLETIKLLDYLYSEEGRTLLNWGKEGESYELVDSKPQYTDLIMKNPEGLTKLDAVAKYAVPIYGYFSSFYVDSYSSINLSSPQQKDAATAWAAQDTSMCMPILYPNEEERATISKLGADIDTYTSEMLMKFVIGKEPLDQFDAFAKSIEKMGIQEMIQIYQNIYDRYQSKKAQ